MHLKIVVFLLLLSATWAADLDSVLRRLEFVENKAKQYEETISDLTAKLKVHNQRIAQLENDSVEKDQTIANLEDKVTQLISRSFDQAAEAGSDLLHSGEHVEVLLDSPNDSGLFDNLEPAGNTPKIARSAILSPRTWPLHKRERSMQRRLADTPTAPVAFHAVLDGGIVSHIGINQRIIFNTELMDIGDAFHQTSGLFIAPVRGIYVFSVSIMVSPGGNSEIKVSLKKNGIDIARAYAHGDNGRHDQGSVTVAMQLAIGDEITVDNHGLNDVSLWGDRFDSFTGFLVMTM